MADKKQEQRDSVRAPDPAGGPLTTDQGVAVDHTDDALTVGDRGPTLLEDFHFREKITRFDHERIPERVVHARGPRREDTPVFFIKDPIKFPDFIHSQKRDPPPLPERRGRRPQRAVRIRTASGNSGRTPPRPGFR
jgi:catalase